MIKEDKFINWTNCKFEQKQQMTIWYTQNITK